MSPMETLKFFEDVERCISTKRGEEYVGTISVTKTGRACQVWSQVLDLNNRIKDTYFSDKNVISASNYCRNPTSRESGPWCFFGKNSDEWEECSIPSCQHYEVCKDTVKGEEYDGDLIVTKTGRTCQSWDQQSPHTHRFKESNFPEKDFNKIKNKCRNPDNEKFPWCYTTDVSKRWEYCDVPLCSSTLSQAEYFREKDTLRGLDDFTRGYTMDELIFNITFYLSISKELWTDDVRKKTSLWATQFSHSCQRDLTHYEYCHIENIAEKNGEKVLTFVCRNPLLSVLLITPLNKVDFTKQWDKGPVYEVNNSMDASTVKYMEQVALFPSTISVSLSGNGGPFYLINDNAVPYAATSDGKIVMTISKVGKGTVGMMGGEYFVNEEYESRLRDFYDRVYGEKNVKPKKIDQSNFPNIIKRWNSKEKIPRSLIWNAHRTLGEENARSLLTMVTDGTNLIVGIKPWAYNYYVKKFFESEIKELFLSAGLWPYLDTVTGDLRIIKPVDVSLFSLVVMLDYGRSNKAAVTSVAKAISKGLENIPLRELSEEPLGSPFIKILKDRMSQLLGAHDILIKSLVPCLKAPLVDIDKKSLVDLFNSMLLNPLGSSFKAPGLNFYPGTADWEEGISEKVMIKLHLLSKKAIYNLGVFLRASEGSTVTLRALKSKTCTFYVNYHLFDVSNWDRWDKWPRTRSDHPLKVCLESTISNPFGGLVSIQCDTDDDIVNLNMTRVVRVPIYDRRNDPPISGWHLLKKRNVPWAVLASDSLEFVVPTIAIRNMEDPEPILNLWDQMIKEEFHLRGRSISKTPRELLTTDVQIKAGYMHAGYPIGTFIHYVANPVIRGKYLFATEKIRKEAYWGVTHEVGHNLQHRIFTFSGTVDVTNNVFTLVAIEAMTGLSSWNATEGWVKDTSITNLILHINNRNFTFWQENPFVGLGTYAQLRAAFGWELYRQIFRRYDELIIEYGDRISSMTNDDKIQLWIKETCKLVKMNLLPVYDYWAWPIAENTKNEVKEYPLFFPDDFFTKLTAKKVNEIIEKYGGEKKVTRKPKSIPIIIGPLKNPSMIEGRPVIEEIMTL